MRMIDADALETHEQLEPMGNGMYEYVQVVYKDDIDAAPTIIPERKRGRWIEARDEDPFYYICSECGHGHDFEDPFCPGCGAAMQEGEQ